MSASFNQMVSRQEEYTRRLEEQTLELERAYGQARTACQIVQEVGALYTLKEMGLFLLKKLRDALLCPHIALMVLNGTQDTVFVLSEGEGVTIFRDPPVVKAARDALGGLTVGSLPRELAQKLPGITPIFPLRGTRPSFLFRTITSGARPLSPARTASRATPSRFSGWGWS